MENEETSQKTNKRPTKKSTSQYALKHMKSLIVLAVGLLTVGCATTPTMKSVAGTYALGDCPEILALSGKTTFLENGKVINSRLGAGGGTFEIVGKEVHFFGNGVAVFKVKPNGDLNWIADIKNGKRKDLSKTSQMTWIKLK